MSRRDSKRNAYGSMLVPQAQKQSRESGKKSQKVCGTCRNYSESAWSSDGRGSCSCLKLGSDITANPPVFITEGKEGYLTRTLSDASLCEHYVKMKMIDRDGYECSDPVYRRSIRQLQE